MNIGVKIRELRLKKDMKQIELAKKAGISNTYLSDIEGGRTMPSLKTLIKISEALQVSANIFLANNYVKTEQKNQTKSA